jgi:hypothetical protein
MPAPLFPPVPRPADAGGAAQAILPCVLSDVDAEVIVRDAVTGRTLAPADSDKARIEDPRLLSVPFWRVEVSVDGFHFGLSGASVSVGGARLPIPTGGSRHRDAAIVVCGRTAFPYEARVPAWLQGVVGTPPLELAAHDLVGHDRGVPEGEVVDADLSRDDAERAAVKLLVRSVAPQNALYVKMEPQVVSTTLVRLHVYWADYVYEGEARRHAGERFFVAVSGRDGKVVAAHHPSGLRAAAARFRRLLGGG